jgi:sugar phosphate isomerase/epimerase
MSFSLSTSWNAFRHDDAKAMVFEITALGFETIELSFNLTSLMVDTVEGLASSGQVKVSSVHNFCPVPDNLKREVALPDYFSLSSFDDQEQKLAIRQAKKSIDSAARVGAKAVVLHCGRVEIPDHTRQLIQIYNQGLKNTREFDELKDEMILQREKSSSGFLNNTLWSLDQLNQYAVSMGISLGIENRFYYREIPSFAEIGIILSKFKGSNIFYWHDTGHAQVMENLELARHKDFLDRYAKNMLGMHIHDISGCSDHMAPSLGDFDFTRVTPYLRNDTIKVIEAHHPANGEDLKKSRAFLEEICHGKC